MPQKEALSAETKQDNGISKTISQYFASEEFSRSPKSLNSLYAYSHDLDVFAEFCQREGISTLGELKPESIENLVSQISQGYAEATFNRRVACFRGYLNWAVMEGLVKRSVVEKLPGYQKVYRLFLALNSKEETALIAETQKRERKRDQALIEITLHTGARASEIVGLRRKNVITSSSGEMAVRFPNRKKDSYREVTLDEGTAEIVKAHIEEKWLKPNDPLFPGKEGEPLTRARFWFILKEYGEKIGVPNLNPTTLRNTFVTNFQGDVRSLARVLGIEDQSATVLQSLTSKNTQESDNF